tara:strand:- start:217 stop:897 length:681 start_codon:yes stop_codon:yes gene_type:complete
MTYDNSIINWEHVFQNSENFKNNKPFKFTFIENFFNEKFYAKLFETYPKIDNTWIDSSNMTKSQLVKEWNNGSTNQAVKDGDDPSLSDEWNKFKKYAESSEFIDNFKNFSGVNVTKLKFFKFMGYQKGGFQLPHIHNGGPTTLVIMVYFSKGWKENDPGGTYMSENTDEDSIIFEPYNLDNTMAIFHDGPRAAHGVRRIKNDITRQGLQITLENYSSENGWSAGID